MLRRKLRQRSVVILAGLVVLGATLSTAAAVRDGGDGASQPVRLPGTPAYGGHPLRWPPPLLSDPITIRLSETPDTVELSDGVDYIIEMPDLPVTEAVTIQGGRNVVIVGGEIAIPWQGDDPWISQRRGLLLRDQTGTVHVEGLLVHGDDLSEGIQIAAPAALVQLQRIRVANVRARDQVEFSDNHPDVVQPWGGVRELRIDRLTGETDYQGLFLVANDGSIGRVVMSRVNIRSTDTARYLLWLDDEYPVDMDQVYVDPAPGRSRSETLRCEGRCDDVALGHPPGGDFVPRECVGIGYRTPAERSPEGSDRRDLPSC